jgi:hypothetical protein
MSVGAGCEETTVAWAGQGHFTGPDQNEVQIGLFLDSQIKERMFDDDDESGTILSSLRVTAYIVKTSTAAFAKIYEGGVCDAHMQIVSSLNLSALRLRCTQISQVRRR